ncbi:UDP-N-acetylglucosamine 1-carboxyvinyltransferase [Thermosipho atlanticus]|uniref:UDP-N-acetylglucosamine 1-carboxyvinyltransferase n=1 Tax=Thermosipho atlanticus DSM 15807 TaxID=1123380 RepID=A0A1M5QPR0_9BACT|nr:UDP-N-acetylglucosamine 1-carboxyvinyltransferase [Thermosipho atlanticus]SHH15871.1 UDP-N-acetylglucosamine 1-carboxyvinyltransferase [Thermosipho atlanticus DSM 15807]
MGFFRVQKSKLSGKVKISGAKNAALPILAASLLTNDVVIVENVPDLLDVQTMLCIIRESGKKVEFENGKIKISGEVTNGKISYELVRKMRASFNVLGPLAAVLGKARVALPGGCAIGVRPVDFHIEGLKKLGFEITIEHGEVYAEYRKKDKDVIISLPFPSVGATEHLMTTAAILEGTTIIENAAMEPEIEDLQSFLNKMGAKVSGAGTKKIFIEGVNLLNSVKHKVIPDRIEAGTYAIAIAASGGKGYIENIIPSHLDALWQVLTETGTILEFYENKVFVDGSREKKSAKINILPYPGFPTDLQPQIMVYLSVAKGTSMISENVFKNRFLHVDELVRMGADIYITNGTAIINGVEKLSGAKVEGTDLRASAALIIAGLIAEGTTEVYNDFHVLRGYELIVDKIRSLGGNIEHLG